MVQQHQQASEIIESVWSPPINVSIHPQLNFYACYINIFT